MKIIKIEKMESGAHCNQTIDRLSKIPKGWAVIPDDMEIPSTFPFVDIDVNEDNIVTSMTGGIVPEPEVRPDDEPTTNEIINALLGVE